MGHITSWIHNIRAGAQGTVVNMRRRLLVFLLLLSMTMLLGVFFLLTLFDVFTFRTSGAEKLFEKELLHLSDTTAKQYGEASARAVRMTEELSAHITSSMQQEDYTRADLKNQPELLESLLSEQVPLLLSHLDMTDCSGVFVALDETVNPNIPGSEHSKAGLYIRNTEPSIGGMGADTRLLLRGPSSLSTNGTLNMQAEWDLEFNVDGQPFWQEPIAAYGDERTLPLSRLVYWCSTSPINESSGDVMVCSLPLLDDDGDAWGVCGFEISEMNFTLRHLPDDSEFFHTVFLFSSASNGGIHLDEALFAGNATVYESFPKQGAMRGVGSENGFIFYNVPNGVPLVGMERAIRLYSDDSPFADDAFLAAVVIPRTDFEEAQSASRLRFVVALFILLALGVVASLFLARGYMRPIMDRLAEATDGGDLPEKTNITEIDLLLERFRTQGSPLPENLFDDFIDSVQTLTPAQLVVFQAHAEGKSFEEMTKSLHITLSTLKKHNTQIYEKLGVNSQEGLRLYISLLEKCGMMGRVFAEGDKNGNDS